MAPLSLSGPTRSVPTDYSELLDLLGSRPQPAVVFYSADESRVELSGRVLANWAVKLIGLLSEEYDLGEADVVLLDSPAHWKAAAVLLAASAMGAEVAVGSADDAEVVITDRPRDWIGSPQLGQAELGALSAGMLDASFEAATGEALPAWVLDISAETPQQPDQLLAPLDPVSLPETAQEAASPLVLTDWQPDSVPAMVSTWAHGGVVVLFEGEAGGPRWEQMRRNEGLA
ncbi:TIGR03089 family protein [Garicola koreensis]|uniref:Uncharacterized protein (TIGR03089 family) n=1 Tax=Garicola koreensis TaxID=1262554 RepID=A0A7W5TNA2_9MICC|nr:TIGR03089 family protein [Garicola koreensis]MBB3666480.1 uncharacterized protein (TIGR03089 family) [Garicola koreensis]